MKRMILSALLVAACDMTGPAEEIQGTYALSIHAGRQVPTLWTCGIGDIMSGEVELLPVRQARLRWHAKERGSDREWRYSGEGYYSVSSGVVVLQLRGGWSNNPETFNDRFFFEMEGNALIRRNVGAECDASETEVYTKVEQR